jgi:hypothetical protein
MPLQFETTPKVPQPAKSTEEPSMPEDMDMVDIRTLAEILEEQDNASKNLAVGEAGFYAYDFGTQQKTSTPATAPAKNITFVPGSEVTAINKVFEQPHILRQREAMKVVMNRRIAIALDILIHILLLNIGAILLKKWVHPTADMSSYGLFMILPHLIVISRVIHKHKELG